MYAHPAVIKNMVKSQELMTIEENKLERYTWSQWSQLTAKQKGTYAEYYTKMEFTLFGFDVYPPEIDDKVNAFVVRKGRGPFKEIRVKSSSNNNYIFIPKSKFELREDRMLAILLYYEEKAPQLYLVPSTIWLTPNSLFVSRDYEGKMSKPEWGINLTGKTLPLLETYRFEQAIQMIESGPGENLFGDDPVVK